MSDLVEVISHGDVTLAYLIRAQWLPDKTTFVTPSNLGQQIGMIVNQAGASIVPHIHMPIERHVTGTTECIIVRKGACTVDFYDRDKRYLTSRKIQTNDILLLIDGGHGFRMLEDTVLFEVKQGPYAGERDKERFSPDQERAP